jgi:hypothetical protein
MLCSVVRDLRLESGVADNKNWIREGIQRLGRLSVRSPNSRLSGL